MSFRHQQQPLFTNPLGREVKPSGARAPLRDKLGVASTTSLIGIPLSRARVVTAALVLSPSHLKNARRR